MTGFTRYAPAICFFHLGASLIAASFGAVVLRDGSPVTPELYGNAVYAVPALVWVAVQLAGCALASAGAAIGGPQGAWACAVGSSVSAAVFAALAVMATSAGATGTLVVSGCAFVMAPLSITSAGMSIIYLRGRHGK